MSESRDVTTVIVGAGHSGLAMSYHLAARDVPHVVLERGEVANSWRHERWDSLRLLTPNWQNQLPGFTYEGADPDGFMRCAEVVSFINAYARTIEAPVHTGTCVTSVRADDSGYVVDTNKGTWTCRSVVLASGACNAPAIPEAAARLPDDVVSITAFDYKSPADVPAGGVLVVGASASGLQIAAELAGAGHPVTLAVGEHVRMPRTYRGRDIQHWLQETGRLDEGLDDVDDLVRVRNVPSPQLVGTEDRSTLDLNALTARGVELVGRFAGYNDGNAQFSGSLRNVCSLADLKLGRLLGQIDEWIDEHNPDTQPGERPAPTNVPDSPRLMINLERAGIASVVWATGYRPDYSWLDLPVFDRKGKLSHTGGVVDAAPGVYALGLTFLRRRSSSFIHGADADAADLAEHLTAWLKAGG